VAVNTNKQGTFRYAGIPIPASTEAFNDAWFVDSATGSDSNSGKKPTSPLATIQQGVDLASSYDTIYVAGTENDALTQVDDYDEEVIIPVTKPGIKLIGCGGGPEGVLWGPSAENKTLLTINSNNCQVRNMRLRPYGATGHAIDLLRTTAAHQTGTIIDNCTFRSQTTTAYGIYATGAPNDVKVTNCIFDSLLAAIYITGIGIAVPYRWVVKDCQVNGSCTTGIVGDFGRSLFENVYIADLAGGMMLATETDGGAAARDNLVVHCVFGDANSEIEEVNASSTDCWSGSFFGAPLDSPVNTATTGLFILAPDGAVGT